MENEKIEVWGDGSSIRDFIHAKDVALGMIHVVENKITDFNLDYISYWGGVKRAYPKLYKLYMNDKKDLDVIAEGYGIICSIYIDKNNYFYSLAYNDIPESWDGDLKTGNYNSSIYSDKQIMLKRIIKTIFGLVFLKTNYYGKRQEF